MRKAVQRTAAQADSDEPGAGLMQGCRRSGYRAKPGRAPQRAGARQPATSIHCLDQSVDTSNHTTHGCWLRTWMCEPSCWCRCRVIKRVRPARSSSLSARREICGWPMTIGRLCGGFDRARTARICERSVSDQMVSLPMSSALDKRTNTSGHEYAFTAEGRPSCDLSAAIPTSPGVAPARVLKLGSCCSGVI